MLVGVDLDNTIIDYGNLFHRVAVELGWRDGHAPQDKRQVRDALRGQGREEDWILLQGMVYGQRLAEARPSPGVLEFFRLCRRAQAEICVVSHKTRHPAKGPKFDLHKATLEWLEANGFFSPERDWLSPDQVYLELSREDKITRIAELGCTCFIDDLLEVLQEPAWPVATRRILYAPVGAPGLLQEISVARSWADVADLALGPGNRLC